MVYCLHAMKKYTTVQVARLLGIGRDTLYRWMRAKKIKPPRVEMVGDMRLRQWTKQDVDQVRAFMAENYHKGRGRKPRSPEGTARQND